METAIQRRVRQELGVSLPFQYLYKFEYQATYREQNRVLGSEHELCWVYCGVTDSTLDVNVSEIQSWKWISPQDLTLELEHNAERYTPWFKMEWKRLMDGFQSQIDACITAARRDHPAQNNPPK